MHTTKNYGFLIPPKYKVDWYQDFVNLIEQIDNTIKIIENCTQYRKIKFWNSYTEFSENAEINEMGLVKISPTITELMVKIADNYILRLHTTGLYLTRDGNFIQLMFPHSKLVLGWEIDPQLVREKFSLFGNIDLFGGDRFINSYTGTLTLRSKNVPLITLDGNNFLTILSGNIRIPHHTKGINKVLTCVDNEGTCEWRELPSGGGGGGGGGSGDVYYTFNCEQRGNAWGYGHFYKFDYNADNSALRSLTSKYDNSKNLYMCPFVAPESIRIVKIVGTIYYCSVHAVQPTYPCFLRLRFQKNLASSRQQIGDVLVPVSQANGWNNQDNIVYQQINVNCENQNLVVNAGENWGVEFIGEQASNRIVQIRGVYLQIVAKKI